MLLAVLILGAGRVSAFGPAAESPLLYFEMGGGEPIREPVSVRALPLVGVSAAFTTPGACELWDIKHADQLLDRYEAMVVDYIEGSLDQLGQAIMINVTAFAQGLLAAAIQRAMPGMYDYSQNVHAQLSSEIEVAKQSCESVMSNTLAGNNPLKEWKDASKVEAWKNALGVQVGLDGALTIGGAANIIRAEETVAKDEGTTSVPWFGGEKGGKDKAPIKLVNDAVRAGYALLANQKEKMDASASDVATVSYRNPLNNTSSIRPSRLGGLWKDGDAAALWATKVLGERIVSFCPGCASEHQGGAGLLAAFYEERQALEGDWNRLLTLSRSPSIADMASVSAGGVHLSIHVFRALDSMIAQDKKVYVERLIADAALSRTAEKAMALRRLLRTAQSTPQVGAYPHVATTLSQLTDDIKAELDEMQWELSLQQNLSSHAAASLLGFHQATKNRSLQIPGGTGTQQTGAGTVDIGDDRPVKRE